MQGEFWFNEHVYADPLSSDLSSSHGSPARRRVELRPPSAPIRNLLWKHVRAKRITLGEKAMVNLPESNYLPVDLSTNFDVSSNETESSRVKSIHSIP